PGTDWNSDGLFRFGSWVGGDRDGNPNVDAAVTAETLRFHRERALSRHLASLEELARGLSVAGHASAELLASIERDAALLPSFAAALGERFAAEPYRRKLRYTIERVERGRDGRPGGY